MYLRPSAERGRIMIVESTGSGLIRVSSFRSSFDVYRAVLLLHRRDLVDHADAQAADARLVAPHQAGSRAAPRRSAGRSAPTAGPGWRCRRGTPRPRSRASSRRPTSTGFEAIAVAPRAGGSSRLPAGSRARPRPGRPAAPRLAACAARSRPAAARSAPAPASAAGAGSALRAARRRAGARMPRSTLLRDPRRREIRSSARARLRRALEALRARSAPLDEVRGAGRVDDGRAASCRPASSVVRR